MIGCLLVPDAADREIDQSMLLPAFDSGCLASLIPVAVAGNSQPSRLDELDCPHDWNTKRCTCNRLRLAYECPLCNHDN